MKQVGINLLGLLVFFIFGCKSSTPPPNTAVTAKDNQPSWIKSRPIDGTYYIGIAGTSKIKDQFDYASNAKSRALEDLASEIKVRVESNSVLYQLDRNDNYRDSYESIIQSKTSQEIEEFELVDSWETETEYWVYYRLSRSKFKELQLNKQRTAQNLALDLFKKAKGFESQEQMITALSTYLASLKAIQDYLGDLNEVTYEGSTIYLGTEIFHSMQTLLKQVELKAPSSLTYKRGVTRDLPIDVNVLLSSNQSPLANIPVVSRFTSGKGELSAGVQSNDKGEATFILSSVSSPSQSQEVVIEIDLEKIKQQDPLNGALLASLQLPKKVISLAVSGPTMYFNSTENILGSKSDRTLLKDHIIKNAVNKGFTVTDNKSSSDLICTITADTKKGTDNSGIFSSYMTASFSVENTVSKKVIYSGKLIDIKGVQLDFQQAGEDAYKKALKQIDKKILPEMEQVIFE